MKTKIETLAVAPEWGKSQLVCNDSELVLLTTGSHTEHEFEGMVLHPGITIAAVGSTDNDFLKSKFTLFSGSITLSND